MNYQYNQQPQAYPQMYTNEQKKAVFETFSEKMAEFCKTNGFLSVISRGSHITTYILTGFSLIMGIILCFLKTYSAPLVPVVMVFAVLSLSKKTILPMAISVSYAAGMELTVTILHLVKFCKSHPQKGVLVGGIFQYIFLFIVVIVLVVVAIVAWMQFAATLPPKAYPPQGYAQVPPQGGYQQPPMQQAAPQQPPMQQAAPQQPSMQQPQAPASPKVCPACGMVNDPESGFCRGCGAKI